MAKIVLQLSLKEAQHVYLALKLYNKAILKAKCDNDTGDTIAEETDDIQKTLNSAIVRNTGIGHSDTIEYYNEQAKYILSKL